MREWSLASGKAVLSSSLLHVCWSESRSSEILSSIRAWWPSDVTGGGDGERVPGVVSISRYRSSSNKTSVLTMPSGASLYWGEETITGGVGVESYLGNTRLSWPLFTSLSFTTVKWIEVEWVLKNCLWSKCRFEKMKSNVWSSSWRRNDYKISLCKEFILEL